jgi:hypothetical protein
MRKIEAKRTLFIPQIGKIEAKRSLFQELKKIEAKRTRLIPEDRSEKKKLAGQLVAPARQVT